MFFLHGCEIDKAAIIYALGYGESSPDERTVTRLHAMAAAAERAAAPRWTYASLALEGKATLQGGVTPGGQDIIAHLEGCESCYLLALTLGAGIEREIRAAETADMADAVLLDLSASVLTEQYAEAAQGLLRDLAAKEGFCITGRFSPGYGDLPLSFQRELLDLTDARRRIGLTANENHILIPRKSITAILGVSSRPVTGRTADCRHCALREKCDFHLRGGRGLCGKTLQREMEKSDE